MGEHLADGSFRIAEITIHPPRAVAFFVRLLENSIHSLKRFFQHTGHNYRQFNYLGEWHSHPNFPVTPSGTDHRSMWALVKERQIGANFAVLMVIKLGKDGALEGTAHAYMASGELVSAQWHIES